MKQTKNIIWLASFPKSGNTWFRMFLSALLNDGQVDINKPIVHRSWGDDMRILIKAQPTLINYQTRAAFIKQVYSKLNSDLTFIKVHQPYKSPDGLLDIPNVLGAICIIRNPLDVVMSLSHFNGESVSELIDKHWISKNPDVVFRYKYMGNLLEDINAWSCHTESWLACHDFPVYFVRYEDMLSDTFKTFKSSLQAFNLSFSDEAIQQAIEATQFEKLRKQEQENGFDLNVIPNRFFFNKGKSGRWKEELSNEQIEKIREINEPMMRHFGYW